MRKKRIYEYFDWRGLVVFGTIEYETEGKRC